MTLSDPTFGGINGGITTADTRQHREQQSEAVMNSSVLYMHEVRIVDLLKNIYFPTYKKLTRILICIQLHSRQGDQPLHISTVGSSGARFDGQQHADEECHANQR